MACSSSCLKPAQIECLRHSINLGEIKLLWEKKKKRRLQDFLSSLNSLNEPNTELCSECRRGKRMYF